MSRHQPRLSPDLTEALQPNGKNDARVTARAWKRALLNEEGLLHADGIVILRDLLRLSEFFGPQYVVGKPERTLELAVKRQLVIHILAMLGLPESYALQQRELLRQDDDN